MRGENIWGYSKWISGLGVIGTGYFWRVSIKRGSICGVIMIEVGVGFLRLIGKGAVWSWKLESWKFDGCLGVMNKSYVG